ncbi:Galactose/methyl galactoside import ATP-binding protein MglA [Marinomonas spartinae]|uniref:ABC transporter ATP-binding protein n=1 Tax=Marinomonas spartinae TaxID=1792290 RepID=UPI000809016A|nr:ABC transporter ATP-binding protein [Marinomonas spartinae]SBS40218.1 Galactose/methyl galactoside import ATP-binding protein MglA [Marinomonas spartinae]
MINTTIPYAIELRDISKRFGAVQANKDICLQVPKGSIHGIIGENGAGKSTLMSIIYGFYEADTGHIEVDGEIVNIRTSQDAIKAGIGMVHQHFMLVENFTVLENVMLGAEGGALLRKGVSKARAELKRLASQYSLDIDVDAIVEELPVGLQQRVEILKALYRGARILILDEPTGVLTPQEADHLFRILHSLKEKGVTVLLITHKLREILASTDNVSVMRQGEMVAHRETSKTNKEELAELMVGKKVRLTVNKEEAEPGKVVLSAKHLSQFDSQGVKRLKDVSLELRAGEILGIAGVSGNGQSELLNVLSGITVMSEGEIHFAGDVISATAPKTAAQVRDMGMAHVPEDRHKMGLVTGFEAYESAVLGYHNSPVYNGKFLMNRKVMLDECSTRMAAWDVRPPNPYLKTANFSGGNQQKIVIAREVEQNPDVLLIGQPTRGVDIGAIENIHEQIVSLRDAGKAILLVSVELDEIMALSDRILVMFDGAVVGELDAKDANERVLGLMMANSYSDDPRGEPA